MHYFYSTSDITNQAQANKIPMMIWKMAFKFASIPNYFYSLNHRPRFFPAARYELYEEDVPYFALSTEEMDMLAIGEKRRYEDVYNLTHHTYIKNEGNDVQRMWICWLASNPNILVTDWSRIPEKDCLLTLRFMLAIALNRHDIVEHLINDAETKKHQFTPPHIAALIEVLHFEWAHINESIWNRMAHWLNDLLPAAEYIAQLTTATDEKRLTSLLVCLEQFYKILNDPKDLDIKKALSSNGCVPRAKLRSVLLAGEQFCLMAVTTHNFNLLPLIAENCPTLYDNAWKNKSSVNESPVSGPAVSPMS